MLFGALIAFPGNGVEEKRGDRQRHRIFLIDSAENSIISRIIETAAFGIKHLIGTGPTEGGRFPLQQFAGMNFFVVSLGTASASAGMALE